MPRRLTPGPIVLCTVGPSTALSPILQRASGLSGSTVSLEDDTVSGDIAVTGAILSVTLDDATVSGSIDVVRTASLSVTLDDATVAGTAAVTDDASFTVTVDPVRFSSLPMDYELGVGGSTAAHEYMTVGTDRYVWYGHTNAAGVVTNPDPGDTEAALAGHTGTMITLAAGLVTAETRAGQLATALAGLAGVNSAAAAVSANDDGSWNVDVVTDGRTVATGTRTWASRGAAGVHGSHLYRVPGGSEIAGDSAITINRMVATRITAPPATAILLGVQIALGGTVSAGAQRVRLQYWISSSSTTPGTDTEAIFDFGQIPADQATSGGLATIGLTAAQSVAFRAGIDAASGTNHWISVHASSGTQYIGIPPARTDYIGETAGENVRVHASGSQDATVANTTWTSTGETNFAFMVPVKLLYAVDPCTTGESRTTWGSAASYADHPSNITLPDTETAQTAPVDGLEAARIAGAEVGIASGQVRIGIRTGGTTTPGSESLGGATVLADLGQTTTTGENSYRAAPTGASTVRVPTTGGMWLVYKGTGSGGRGETAGPFVVAPPNSPSSWVNRSTGGTNTGERDNSGAAGHGDDSNPFQDPVVSSSEFAPNNHPSAAVELFTAATTVTPA